MKKHGKKAVTPLSIDPGQQYAALPYRDKGGLKFLLVTSRETRRWVIPKGWPMKGRKPHAAAAREALEEAGVTGRVSKKSIGSFGYIKRLKNGAPLQCTVEVFPLKVARQLPTWPEQHERTYRWFSPEEAAAAVEEAELQALIETFAQALVETGRKKVANDTAPPIEPQAEASEPRTSSV